MAMEKFKRSDHFVDVPIESIYCDVKEWCSKNANGHYYILHDDLDKMYVVWRIYFTSKRAANKFQKEFDNSLDKSPLSESYHHGTILAMMEKNAKDWEESNPRLAEDIRDQINGKFFQNMAREQIKKREEDG